jgi:hypothetical protein
MGFDIDDIKRANAEAGYYFFSEGTLRFFDSRIGSTVYGVWFGTGASRRMGGQYFITSERYSSSAPRGYTVRRYNPADHTIDTIGEEGPTHDGFQQYSTSQGAAKRAIRECKREQETGQWQGMPVITAVEETEDVTLNFPGFPPVKGVGPIITAVEATEENDSE